MTDTQKVPRPLKLRDYFLELRNHGQCSKRRSLPECHHDTLRFSLLPADQAPEKLLRKIGVNLRAVRLAQDICKNLPSELYCATGIPA